MLRAPVLFILVFYAGFQVFAEEAVPSFYFDPEIGKTTEQEFFANPQQEASFCQIPIRPQIKQQPSCPIPPTRKNGKNCFPGVIPSFDRHASGYGDYLTEQILSAVRQTQMFNVEGVSPMILFSIMAKESFFNPMSYNQWKDMGIAQFQLATANDVLRYMKSIGIEGPASATGSVPPGCQRNKYSTPLSSACFRSIKTNCTKPAYANSLFCPNFAIRLMAFHLLQVQERDVMATIDGARYSMVPLMVPADDQEARLRHILSVYNRGYRIYNSAAQGYMKDKRWISAGEYGPLWSQVRARSNESDPFAGGTLEGHFINRCYVWAIGGLCGGLKDSVIHQFQQRLCRGRGGQRRTELSNQSYDAFSKGNKAEALRYLQAELTRRRVYSRGEVLGRIRLAMTIFENDDGQNTEKIFDLFAYAMKKSEGDHDLMYFLKANLKALKKSTDSFSRALARFNKVKNDRFAGSYEKNTRRLAEFFAIKSQAWQSWQANSKNENLEWLFLSGAAGYHYFGSGRTELRNYVDECLAQDNRNKSYCRFKRHAQQYLDMEFIGLNKGLNKVDRE